MKAPTKTRPAPKRDLFAELSDRMMALVQARQGKCTFAKVCMLKMPVQ